MHEQLHQGFFNLVECNANYLQGVEGLFERLRQGSVQGILLHDVYPQKILPSIVQALESHQPPFLKSWFPEVFNGWFYGRNLNLCSPKLENYFDETRQFERDLEALLPGELNPSVRIASLFSQLDDGRPFLAPAGPEHNQRYMFTSLRGHAEGGYIPAHCDNEFVLRPSTNICVPLAMHIF